MYFTQENSVNSKRVNCWARPEEILSLLNTELSITEYVDEKCLS